MKVPSTTWFSTFSLLSPACWQMQGSQKGTLTSKGMVEAKWKKPGSLNHLTEGCPLCDLSVAVGHCGFQVS